LCTVHGAWNAPYINQSHLQERTGSANESTIEHTGMARATANIPHISETERRAAVSFD
jgi:hypothetical protein